MQNLKYNLVETSSIIFQLESLFENNPTRCLKQNTTGWSTNERILFVREKKLVYAKTFPGFMQGRTIQIPAGKIKAFFNLQDIYEVNYLPLDKVQKKTICILIPEKRINQQPAVGNSGGSHKSSESPAQFVQAKNEQQEKMKLVKWIFHFEFDLKERLSQIMQRRREQMRKKNELNLVQETSNLLQFGRTIAPQQQQNNSAEQEQMGFQEYVNQIKKAKEYIRFKQNRQKMEKQERRKNKPRENTYEDMAAFTDQQENYPISNHWRLYFTALQDVNSYVTNPQKTIYQYQLIVYRNIHNFKATCQGIFKNYILEKINNINGEKWKFGDFYFYKGIWIKLGGKELNQEFLLYYYVSDLTMILNRNLRTSYRVPNVCLLDYMGFKALCMCQLPFSEIQKSQVYNLYNDTYDLQNISKIKENLTLIEKALNLKSEEIQKSLKRVPAPLGPDLRIFEYNPKKDIKTDQSTLQTFYYITNISNILPLDFHFQLEKVNLDCRYRPQLIGDVRQILEMDYDDNTQLLSTAFMVSGMNQEVKTMEDDKIVKISKFLLRQKIPQLAKKLNDCELIIVDSYSIKLYMSEFGINMRYMYKIHELAKLKYLRDHIEIECLARTVKKMFYSALKEITGDIFVDRKFQKDNEYNQFDIEKSQVNYQNNQQKFKEDQQKFQENTVDFLNLVFGCGEESKAFWKILCEKTEQKFKVKVALPFEGSPGALLHAVLYNCSIDAQFDINIPLFKTESPFNRLNEVTLRPKIKTLQFPSFQIQKLIRSVPNIAIVDHPNPELLQSIALKLFKMDMLKNYYLYQGDFNYHLSFAKVNLVKQDMQKPNHLSSLHPSQITYFIANRTEGNFEKGLNLLTFCFSDFHPLYVSYYEEYSEVYQPQLLKKAAILQSIKCFGQFHPRTSQLYSWTYGQGYVQFYQKSLRSASILSSKVNMQGQFQSGKYYSCMHYCFKQMQMSKQNDSRVKKENCLEYLDMLFMGMKAALQIRYLQESLNISAAISDLLNKFKLRNYFYHYQLIRDILRIKLILTPEKLFLYKLALLCISIQEKYNENIQKDKNGRLLPAEEKQKEDLSTGIMNQYFSHDTHTLWLGNIFKHLLASFQYFNHLDDLFNNFQYHMQRYDNSFFKESLGYWDILVRLYGEDMFRNYLYQTGNI